MKRCSNIECVDGIDRHVNAPCQECSPVVRGEDAGSHADVDGLAVWRSFSPPSYNEAVWRAYRRGFSRGRNTNTPCPTKTAILDEMKRKP